MVWMSFTLGDSLLVRRGTNPNGIRVRVKGSNRVRRNDELHLWALQTLATVAPGYGHWAAPGYGRASCNQFRTSAFLDGWLVISRCLDVVVGVFRILPAVRNMLWASISSSQELASINSLWVASSIFYWLTTYCTVAHCAELIWPQRWTGATCLPRR